MLPTCTTCPQGPTSQPQPAPQPPTPRKSWIDDLGTTIALLNGLADLIERLTNTGLIDRVCHWFLS